MDEPAFQTLPRPRQRATVEDVPNEDNPLQGIPEDGMEDLVEMEHTDPLGEKEPEDDGDLSENEDMDRRDKEGDGDVQDDTQKILWKSQPLHKLTLHMKRSNSYFAHQEITEKDTKIRSLTCFFEGDLKG
jgi:hypothetical protein